MSPGGDPNGGGDGLGPCTCPTSQEGPETVAPRIPRRLVGRTGPSQLLAPPRPMAAVSLFAFIFGALLGLTMAWMHFKGQKSGMALGIAHGVFTLSGLALLATGLVMREASLAWWILASFGVVAAGGAYLFSRQVRDKPWPALVIVAHGGLAIVTIVVLAVWLGKRETPPDEADLETAEAVERPAHPAEVAIAWGDPGR